MRRLRLKRLLIIGAGIIFGLFILMVVLALVLPQPEPAPVTSVVSATPVAGATEMPEPATDVPLAPTPVPTHECPTAEELAYFQELTDIVNATVSASRTFVELNVELSENTALYPIPPWQEKASNLMYRFEAIADRIAAIEAPESVEKVHDDLLDVESSMRRIPGLYSRGVYTQDGGLINDTLDEWEKMTEGVKLASEKALSFCD